MMPTQFRWVWYLVGLAGMVLTIVGVLAILGSAADLGILVPVVFVGAVAIGYVIVRFRRSLDAAVAAAPSRQGGAAGERPRVRNGDDRDVEVPAPVARRVHGRCERPFGMPRPRTRRPGSRPAARPGRAAAALQPDPLPTGVDVEPVAAQEPDEGLPEPGRRLDGEVGRGGDGADERRSRRRPPSGRSRG